MSYKKKRSKPWTNADQQLCERIIAQAVRNKQKPCIHTIAKQLGRDYSTVRRRFMARGMIDAPAFVLPKLDLEYDCCGQCGLPLQPIKHNGRKLLGCARQCYLHWRENEAPVPTMGSIYEACAKLRAHRALIERDDAPPVNMRGLKWRDCVSNTGWEGGMPC